MKFVLCVATMKSGHPSEMAGFQAQHQSAENLPIVLPA
jgi:hypothetical protein